MIHFACPQCRRHLKADHSLLKRKTRCPGCGSLLIIQESVGALVVTEPPVEVTAEPEPPEPPQVRLGPLYVVDDGTQDLPAPASAALPMPEWEYEAKGNRMTLFLLSFLGVAALIGVPLVIFIVASMPGEKKATGQQVARGKTRAPDQDGERRWDESAPHPTARTPTANATPPATKPPQPPQPPPTSPNPQPGGDQRPQVELPDPAGGKRPSPPKGKVSPKTPPSQEEPDPETRARITALKNQLKSRRPADRVRAAADLAQLGPKAKGVSRAICENLLPGTLNTPDVLLASKAALEQIDPALYGLVEPLLYDPHNIDLLSKSVWQIEQLGADGNAATPILVAYWYQRHGGVPILRALASVAPDEKTVTDLFRACLKKDRSSACRASAAQLLPRLEGAEKCTGDLILAMRTDPASSVRCEATTSLGELGVNTREVVRALQLATADPLESVREAAKRALARIQESR